MIPYGTDYVTDYVTDEPPPDAPPGVGVPIDDTERAAAGRQGEEFPPPSQPVAVARQLQPDWLHDDQPTLRSWRRTWMRWEHAHWAEVDEQEVRASLYRRLEHARYVVIGPNGEPQSKPWAPTKKKIADLVDALGAITLLPSSVDAPSWADRRDEGVIVACRNGLLRVADRQLLGHDPRFFNLVSVPFDYQPAAAPPERWLSFLRDTWTDDEGNVDTESIDVLQEFFGYVVSGRTNLHKILLIVGPTRSGKGTIARVLTALVGKGNMAGPTLASLATNFGLAPLLGKPLAIVSDARLGGGGGHQVVERLLTISGEDTIDVDRKFRESWTGRLPTRFLILSNQLPSFGDASGAIAHRFIVLSMQRSWLGQENTGLTGQLTAELPGILNWALDGLVRLTNRGRFTEPESSVDAVIAMKDSASPMSAFVRECCRIGAGKQVPVDDLWAAWKAWCEDAGRDRPGTKQQFGKDLQSVVPQARRSKPRVDGGEDKRIPTYLGLELKSENHNGADRGPARPDMPPADPVPAPGRAGPRSNPLQPQHSVGALFGAPGPVGLACEGCGDPLDPALAAAGDITHPSCEPIGAHA
jgi:putative DNA primase/helicase